MSRLEQQHAEIEALGAQKLQYGLARAISRHHKLLQFVAHCAEHWTYTLHNTKTGLCVECHPETPTGRPVEEGNDRAAARRQGLKTYVDYCPIHVTVPFSVAHGRCLTCFNTSGAPRKSWDCTKPLSESPRAEARRAGASSYGGECPKHGPTPFSVAHGRCLTCFTAGGTPRRMVRVES